MTIEATPVERGVVSEVRRRRTLGLLDDASSSVIVISAPAGSGKSTVARQWVAGGDRAHATLLLDSYMDDPVVLGQKLVDVLETLGPVAPGMRTCLTAKEPVFSSTLLPGLTRLAASRGAPYVLVLDDLHRITSPRALQLLTAICAGVPDGSAVVLLTRSVTPAWLSRIRATGRLTELSAEHLQFDVDETTRLLEGMGVRAGRSEATAIVEHTEGWAVGVYLNALSLRSDTRDAPSSVRIAKGSDRIVADWLRTQVLAPLSEEHRRFMVMTSILDELGGPLCDAVVERTDSATILTSLHERVQLVIAIDHDERRFRYHHLLAEELLSDLGMFEAADVAALHARAAMWFDDNGDRDSAIRHATATGDTGLASRMIWPEVAACVASGRLDRLNSWLNDLTERQLAEDRWLSMAATWASLQQGDADAMGRWARVVEGHAGPGWREEASRDSYAATLAVLHGLVGSGGLEDTRDLCDRALHGLAPADRFRAPAAVNRGASLTLQRDFEGGRASLIEAESLGRSLGVPIVEANAKSWLGLLALMEGERERGIAYISAATDVIHEHHLDRLATGAFCMTAQALVLALVGDKAAASTSLATARRLSGLAGEIAPWFAVTGRVIQARTAVLLGDGATARQLMSEAKARMTPELRDTLAQDYMLEVESALAQMSATGGPVSALTTSELRILQFLPSHLTLQQIGEHLFVSQSTVKTHVLSIYRKFGVSSRAEAVARARALGLVEAPIGE